MKKKPVNDDSDEFDADEPEEFAESGSDWDPEEEQPKKRKGRPKPTPKKAAPNKKKKVEDPPSEEEEEEEEEEDEEEEDEEEEGEDSEDEDAPGNGSFVVLKSDFKSGGTSYPLWKIDGKALLQKFVPHEKDGKVLYKNTSTYSGWTQNNRNQYAAAPVKYIVQSKKEVIIEFLKDKVDLEEGEKDIAAAGAATATADA